MGFQVAPNNWFLFWKNRKWSLLMGVFLAPINGFFFGYLRGFGKNTRLALINGFFLAPNNGFFQSYLCKIITFPAIFFGRLALSHSFLSSLMRIPSEKLKLYIQFKKIYYFSAQEEEFLIIAFTLRISFLEGNLIYNFNNILNSPQEKGFLA